MEQNRARGVATGVWVLIVLVAVGVTALVIYNSVQIAGLDKDVKLRSAMSRALTADSRFRDSLAQSDEFVSAREDLGAMMAQDEAFISTVLERPELHFLINQSARENIQRHEESGEFAEAVAGVLEKSEVTNRAAAPQIERMQASLARYERELANLAEDVADDESAAAVAAMQGQLTILKDDIDGLATQVGCALKFRDGPRDFLLKSNSATRLPGFDLVISLGRIKGEVIESVSVSSPNESQVNTKVIAGVALGTPITFQQGSTIYEGMFTFAQSRLFSRAFIGFEIRPVSSANDECLPKTVDESSADASQAG